MNSWFLKIYLLLYLLVVGLALSNLPWEIDADMYSVLPQNHALKDVSQAELKWSKNNSADFMILAGGKTFEEAKQSALLLHGDFAKDNSLETFELFTDTNAVQNLRNFFFENKMRLQTREFAQALNTDANAIRSQAFAKIYGANPLISLENIDSDPFLLGENGIERIMGKHALGSWEIRDGMRVAKDGDDYYVLINGKLAKNVSSMGGVIGKIREKTQDLNMAFSGIPFHVNESSASAAREVAIITTVSILAVILLLFFAFRSAFPLVATVSTTLLAALLAASAVQLIFGQIHVFTFVFGTSIIGLSLDYSIHFFSHWKNGENGFNVRAKIITCIALGFLTTQLGYIALMTTQFPLLSQMAVFSFFGLLSVFLSVSVVFPYFKFSAHGKLRTFGFDVNKTVRIVVLVALFVVLALGCINFKIENRLQEFYSMSKKLQTSEMLAAKITNTGSGLFYIVSGNSPEETLQREEALCSQLDSLGSYLAVSSFVPSAKFQSEVFASINERLLPLYAEQFALLGIEANFQKDEDNILSLESPLPVMIRQMADKLWIGEINGKYYSAVLLLNVRDRELLKELQIDGAVLVDKRNEIEAELTVLSKKIIFMILAAYAGALLVFSLIYNFRSSVKILIVPLLASATAASIMSLLGISMSFFAIAGLILTLAIGIDYSLFFSKGNGSRDVRLFAVSLSMLTTVLSFGLLSFSSFTPVSHLGISVSIGIVLCFVLSFFLILSNDK